MTDSWLSVLPPLVAIGLAMTTRQVVLSLFAGLWLAWTLLSGFHPLTGLGASLQACVDVFGDAGDTRVLMFTLLVGALIATLEFSGGVRGFVRYLETRRYVHTGRRARLLAWAVGVVIFIESNITLLVAGSVSRPLFDRYGLSREKLAYLIDATSAPVCAMIPLNAWGAVIIGLVAGSGVDNALATFISSIPYNLYSWLAVLLGLFVAIRGWSIGPMRAAEARTQAAAMPEPQDGSGEQDGDVPSAWFMTLPVLVMVVSMPIALYVTGDGTLIEGSGSTSVLWSVSAALAAAWLMLLVTSRAGVAELMDVFMVGAGKLLPIAIILLLALALGDATRELGTGPYVAGIAGATLPPLMLAPLVFLVSAFIAFSVGSSWGTFAIMIPIALSIAGTLDLSAPLFLGAAVSGAIFGDHASPISDTTVVASLAAGTDHIEHVRTQLPYALLAGAVATVGFFLLGMVT